MNEDNMVREKIEKREKFDKVLAYILLVIILACIGIVLYLKFFKEEAEVKPEEYNSDYLTLEKIVTLLNNGELANEYKNEGLLFTVSNEEEVIKISYTKDDKNTNLDAKLINNELEINLSENEEFATLIYKEIGKIVCTYYGNDENSCKTEINNLNSDNTSDGIRFVTADNKNFVYINITKSIEINSTSNEEKEYTKETIIETNQTDYKLNIENTTISNISIISDEGKLIVNGHIASEKENDVLKINVKLYDQDDKVLKENTKEYTTESSLNKEDDFKIEFELNDDLKSEDIKKYSINVVR